MGLVSAGVSSFAATPSGWLTGVSVPLACVYLGVRLPRLYSKRIAAEQERKEELTSLKNDVKEQTADLKRGLESQNRTLTATATGLAVIVEQMPRLQDDLTIAENNITAMDRARVRLEMTVANHDEWAREHYQELRERIDANVERNRADSESVDRGNSRSIGGSGAIGSGR